MSIFTGSGVAIITPFTENNEVNYERVRELIEFHITEGTDSIIICGTTGEASTLDDIEHRALIKFAVDVVNKRVPLIAGTGSNDTNHGVHLSEYAESVGADALLCVTPYYNKASQEGLYRHFKAMADAVDIPIILYNVPSRTGCGLSVETVKRLSELDNIVAIKEASGNISYAAEIARQVPDFDIYSGNDDIIVPILSLGGKGVISVVANIMPKETHDIVSLFLEGKVEESRNLQLQMNELINTLFIDVNPIPVKTAMNILGYEVGPLRLPLCEMNNADTEILKEVMSRYTLKEWSNV
ncbi:4-hydroxy-tetrahydrodipicolinate synthase [Acidaminobacter sp. JC074]|uniref:4-hydroxy-tetrahydrodipicolinate synthase n=1 Tax=Acidaminobacter sp. JC074 TaxID=2530199 RepID=UPI001F0D280B|nr:4-hydroxy-tetrahydrodipicolinate synthase [Acidaminobacter sp. JC074]MCH4891270.1 4-hydroxy-tetrahydrodipicolinate synthase [Acidaminobacter sp. JC074]